MARKAAATQESVIRYFVSAMNVDALITFNTVKTILEAKGVIASRKRPAKKALAVEAN